MNRLRLRRMRGGATVEMAIMAIILVPIIMYYLFLEDALYFKLNAQEPVVAAPFDMLTMNYNMPTKDVGYYNRLIYCDHSSAYDSAGNGGSKYDPTFDCQGSPPSPADAAFDPDNPTAVYAGTDKGHHTEKGAHQCWITAGAKQLYCSGSGSAMQIGTNILAGPSTKWIDYYNKGALTTCSDRVGVMNYVIMARFFSWSARGQNLTGGSGSKAFGGITMKHNRQHAHADYKDNNQTNSILMPEQKLAVLTDPWALNHLDEVKPDDQYQITSDYKPGEDAEGRLEKNSGKGRLNRLSNRAGTYFLHYGNSGSGGGQAAFTSVNDFFSNAKNSFLVDNARKDGIGDEPESLPVWYTKEKTRKAKKEGYASGWADSRQSGMNRPNTYPTTW